MNKTLKYLSSILLVTALTACGGGGGGSSTGNGNNGGVTPINQDPIITVDSSASLNENTEKTLTVSVQDDSGTPTWGQPTTNVSGLTVSLSGNTLTLKAGEVSKTETGTVTLTATDSVTSKQVSKQIAVTVNNVVVVEAVKDGSPISGSIVVDTTNSAKVSLKDKNGTSITLSNAKSSNPEVAYVTYSGVFAEIKALKDGEVTVTLEATVEGQAVSKSFNAKVTGNKMPSLELSQFNIQMVEDTQNTVNVTIYDEDKTALPSGLSVLSENSQIASATLSNSTITINGLTVGKTRIAVKLQDTPHTLTTYINVEVTEAGLPTLVLNRNRKLEMTEDETAEFDIEIVGAKSEEYTPTVKIKELVGELTDISYKVEGRKLLVTSKLLPVLGNSFNTLYSVSVTATNGKKTITGASQDLFIFKKMNAVPIFEFSNVFGPHILLNQTGETRITVTINDDAPENVKMLGVDAWYNKSTTGSYTVEVLNTDKAHEKTLVIKTTGFNRNETLGFLLGYSDGQLGGKLGLQFRTYNFTEADKEVIAYANVTAAKVEALKEYVEIAKFYAEVLENDGVLTSLEADNYVDLITTEDVDNFRFETVEYYISMAYEMALNDEFNKDIKLVETMKLSLDSLYNEVKDKSGAKNIELINEMASKSSDMLPQLTYETTVNNYDNVYYSKFVGNSKYGEYKNSVWVFKPEYSFLNATKLRMQDNYKARAK